MKNNYDVQKVREAILSSIDNSNTEYGSYERRKLRFLNSIDESKDIDLLKKKFRYRVNKFMISNRDSQHKSRPNNNQNNDNLLEK